MFDYLIVGAGLSGCVVAERIANLLDKKVLIIERTHHIGGHCYDYYDENGILVHKYGPHIFHTNFKNVFSYLSQFTEWIPYFHKVLGVIDGQKVPIPFNINSLYQLFPKIEAEKYTKLLINNFGYNVKVPILKLRATEEKELKFLADYIYEKIFYAYTLKQWDLKPDKLDPSVTERVPIFISQDNGYFQDIYQVMPKYGYTKMFENIIHHKNIKVLLNTSFDEINKLGIKYNKLIYTGQIDEYFEYEFGELPYRSLKFKLETFDMEFFQETALINYPNNFNYTRITEFKHFGTKKALKTLIAYEYPEPYNKNYNIPFYPVPRKVNRILYEKYIKKAVTIKNIKFLGRLANYKYINMDQAVENALNKFEDLIK